MTILAALDDSEIAGAVVDTARRLGALLEVPVEAIHVQERGGDDGRVCARVAESAGVPLRVRAGEVGEALRSDVRERGATMLVIGARRPGADAAPTGHVTLDVVQTVDCTIVVVPPGHEDRPVRRVLVAVEGDGESRGLRGLFRHLGDRSAPEVIAVHVIEPSALPPFADSPVLEAEAFEREFGIRAAGNVLPDKSRVRFELRVGEAPDALREAVIELDADLVVLAWHRDLSRGHARMVREMVERAPVPVVLVPLERTGPSSSNTGPSDSHDRREER
jgi:nucleotide-binding universal stress UspA family protein